MTTQRQVGVGWGEGELGGRSVVVVERAAGLEWDRDTLQRPLCRRLLALFSIQRGGNRKGREGRGREREKCGAACVCLLSSL
jgi:hypothetical protein